MLNLHIARVKKQKKIKCNITLVRKASGYHSCSFQGSSLRIARWKQDFITQFTYEVDSKSC